jgi:hypothetical protein
MLAGELSLPTLTLTQQDLARLLSPAVADAGVQGGRSCTNESGQGESAGLRWHVLLLPCVRLSSSPVN